MFGSYSAVQDFVLFTLSLTSKPKYEQFKLPRADSRTLLREDYSCSRSSFILSSLRAMGLGIDLGTDKAAIARALRLDF
jgi:uncharacterized protein (UPF0128 family)